MGALEIGKHFFNDKLHSFLSKYSEIILECELNLTHACSRRGDGAKRRLRRDIRSSPARGRVTQFHMIGSIEHFHAQLEGVFLGYAEVLNRRQIEVHLFWSNQAR